MSCIRAWFGGIPVGLATLSEVQGLPTECALVDETLLSSGEGHAVVLELAHCSGRLTAHVLDSILQAKVGGKSTVYTPPIVYHYIDERLCSMKDSRRIQLC